MPRCMLVGCAKDESCEMNGVWSRKCQLSRYSPLVHAVSRVVLELSEDLYSEGWDSCLSASTSLLNCLNEITHEGSVILFYQLSTASSNKCEVCLNGC